MSELNTTNGTAGFSLCFFCNNSTNGLEKRLFATLQPKGPFFPVLADLQGKGKKLDALGRAVVCVACFHHLLRQWSSYERRGIPIRKREYSIIAGMATVAKISREHFLLRKNRGDFCVSTLKRLQLTSYLLDTIVCVLLAEGALEYIVPAFKSHDI